ncbi:hypothetical protein PoB_006243200 [Plakobranchus ocellatus]|uniref:Uncharacterized protein n=1 Tax=Plakobranchus ocellatus TaxID=259542 RepID=A0AAV4CVJ4_9GAST|nr:hypothetical protein PoB_006243200 [Plakobranchus ocellatus]
MSKEGDIDLTVWVQTSESPLNSDDSNGGSPRGGFGDLTIIAHSNGENDNGDDIEEEEEEDEPSTERDGDKLREKSHSGYGLSTDGGDGWSNDAGALRCQGCDDNNDDDDNGEASASAENELLHQLANRHDDFLSTVVSTQ